MKRGIKFMILLAAANMVYSQTANTQQLVSINYVKPYKYIEIENNIVAKATLVLENPALYSKVQLNGYTSKIEHKDNKAWVWLPVIGKPEMMKIVASKKHLIREQIFTPLITSDWDYFKDGTFHIISSSHQDIAWMDTPEYCRHERINDIIIPALDIMKTDSEFRFGMEQALNLKEFIVAHPERKNEIAEKQKEGRFTWGATYNQPYEGMQMGEQLIREMYFGKKWIADNFDGAISNTAFNTDVPGRTLQFPQILAKSGVDNLFVSRMKEGFYDWHSPDGSSVLTYTPGNYGWAILFYKLFEGDAIEAMHKMQNRVKMWSDYYRDRNLPPHFAIVLSNDASGPSHYGELVREWNKIIKKTGVKIPSLQHSTVASFMDGVNIPDAKFDYLEGDRPNLWAYIHGPGHHKAVTASRKAGRMLPSAEIFGTVDALVNDFFKNYPAEEISTAFEESIYPDHGWGGKNGHITDSIFRDKLEFAANEADRLLNKSLSSISKNINTKKENAVVVFNDLSWKRNGFVSVNIKNEASYYIVDEKGEEVPSQICNDNRGMLQFYASDIPSIGYKTFYLKKGKSKVRVNKKIVPNGLTNDYYTMNLGNGGINYLYDHILGKEILRTTRFTGGDILTMGYNGNGAGEFVQMTAPNMEGYDKLSNHTAHWKVIADGTVFTEFENKTKLEHTEVVQKIRVFHQEKKITFFVDLLNWDGTHNREFRFALPLNMNSSKITYEVPLAIAEVGTTEMKDAPKGWAWGGTYDKKPETIHPREVLNFIGSENADYGVTMATDVALADWIDPTREAVDYPILQGLLLASHKSCHGEGNWYHQTGNHHFQFSIASHRPSDKTSYQFGVASNHPLKGVLKPEVNKSGKLLETMSFFTISEPMVRISTVKKSEDDDNIIVRLVEMEGKDKEVTVTLSVPFTELIKTNLIEEEEQILGITGKSFKVNIGHNAIDTYKLVLRK